MFHVKRAHFASGLTAPAERDMSALLIPEESGESPVGESGALRAFHNALDGRLEPHNDEQQI